MSSPAYRDALKTFLAANWTQSPILDISDWIAADQVPPGMSDAFLALQFLPALERIAAIGPVEDHAWLEEGQTILHLAFPIGETTTRALAWSDQLVRLLRARRLGAFTIDYCEHFSDFAGAAIQLNGRWHGWSANLGYSSRICS